MSKYELLSTMNIAIIYGGPFPYGQASANRILSYAREMVKLGHIVQVHCLVTYNQPFTSKQNEQLTKNGIVDYEGIQCIYTSGLNYWQKEGQSFFKKLMIIIKGCIGSFKLLYKNRKMLDSLLLSGSEVYLYLFFHLVALVCKLKLIVERSELPDIYKKKEVLGRTIYGWLYIILSRYAFHKVDGWFVETTLLANVYRKWAKKDATFFIAPMTVELDRFIGLKKNITSDSPYIAYCGNMREDDGISILIKAFSLISHRYPSYKLLLAGNSEDVKTQMKIVEDLGIKKKVRFLGQINRDKIPQFLVNADILALASPTSERSIATMPCKVGEYLATGNPVVVTCLGEIPKYLKNGENAFLSEPDSYVKFSDKLDEVISDYYRSRCVGEKGKQVAIREFNSYAQAVRIVNYLETMKK